MPIPDEIKTEYIGLVRRICHVFESIIATAPVEVPRAVVMTALQTLLFSQMMQELETASPEHRPKVQGNLRRMAAQLTALAATEQGQERATADFLADIPAQPVPHD